MATIGARSTGDEGNRTVTHLDAAAAAQPGQEEAGPQLSAALSQASGGLPEAPDPLDRPACRGSVGRESHRARLQRIGNSPRWGGSGFRNTHPVSLQINPFDVRMAADFAFGGKRRAPKGPLPLLRDGATRLQGPPPGGLRLTWLGHSTVLLEVDGVRLLTDPVFGLRASPVSFAGPRRYHPMPLDLHELGRLDAILLSHDHYDHLCAPTWRRLVRGACPGWSGLVITTLGVGAHLERLGVAPSQIRELDWSEGAFVESAGSRVEVIATPSQHFSGRSATDRNRTLWAGLAVVGPRHRVFFSGDTGATPEHAEIGRDFGPFDVAMFEIGAWHPAWGAVHLGPARAFEAFQAMGARALMPIHWATFDLALHNWSEPAETLRQLADAAGASTTVWQPQIGGSVSPGAVADSPWWRDVP